MIVILDTGPLVGFLNAEDQYFNWSSAVFSQYKPPFYTCEAVISEACFRLQHVRGGVEQLWQLFEKDLLQIRFSLEDHKDRIATLMGRYEKMDFADACIVKMTEEHKDCVVLTTDFRDFSRYRRNGKSAIPFEHPPQV